MGTLGWPPAVAYSTTLRDAELAQRGYERRRRDEWERALMLVNAWTGAGLTYEHLTGERKRLDKDGYEALKKRLLKDGDN